MLKAVKVVAKETRYSSEFKFVEGNEYFAVLSRRGELMIIDEKGTAVVAYREHYLFAKNLLTTGDGFGFGVGKLFNEEGSRTDGLNGLFETRETIVLKNRKELRDLLSWTR